jgi:branched-chain amino acid transport system ATP-binding protein
MLAIGRALMTSPKLLILDEATAGLAPPVRKEIRRCLASLEAARQSILVIDQNVAALARIADRRHIVGKGRVVWTGSAAALAADPKLQTRYLGVSKAELYQRALKRTLVVDESPSPSLRA